MGLLVITRLAPVLAFAVAASASTVSSALAYDLSSVERTAGVWELSRGDGARKCSIQLRADTTPAGNALGMPAGCRHSMPAVAHVAAWKFASPTSVELLSQSGVAILSFSAEKTGLTATGPGGEAYVLMAANDVAKGAARPAAAAAAPAPQLGPPVRPAEIPGRYAVLRDGAKDTGCMLTLDAAPRGGGSRAHLAPACRDNGFVIFDPQSWSYVGGKLRLTARKGHSAMFDHAPDGTWQKDPKEGGKPLGFRKM